VEQSTFAECTHIEALAQSTATVCWYSCFAGAYNKVSSRDAIWFDGSGSKLTQ
jgi:hypothetical protein